MSTVEDAQARMNDRLVAEMRELRSALEPLAQVRDGVLQVTDRRSGHSCVRHDRAEQRSLDWRTVVAVVLHRLAGGMDLVEQVLRNRANRLVHGLAPSSVVDGRSVTASPVAVEEAAAGDAGSDGAT